MGVQLELPHVDPPIERVKTAARRHYEQASREALGRCPFHISKRFWGDLQEKLAGLAFGAFMLGFYVAMRKADVDGITYEKE